MLEAGDAVADSDGHCGGGILAVAQFNGLVPVTLDADEATLRVGEAALVPARASFTES